MDLIIVKYTNGKTVQLKQERQDVLNDIDWTRELNYRAEGIKGSRSFASYYGVNFELIKSVRVKQK